jgi:phage repressor protein C with HTH and peptisase S24 domain
MRQLTQAKLAEMIGVSEGAVSRYESDERRLTLPLLRRLAETLHCTIAQITGEAPPEGVDEAFDKEYAEVPVYDVRASAGPGLSIEEEAFKHRLLFRRDFLRSVTPAPVRKLCVIEASGDSMFPTIANGDQLLVDLTQTTPREDGIYVLRIDDDLIVKRVVVDPVRRQAHIGCDNRAYEPLHPVDLEDLHVAGRVIWIGRRV